MRIKEKESLFDFTAYRNGLVAPNASQDHFFAALSFSKLNSKSERSFHYIDKARKHDMYRGLQLFPLALDAHLLISQKIFNISYGPPLVAEICTVLAWALDPLTVTQHSFETFYTFNDEHTGVFTWLVSRPQHKKLGNIGVHLTLIKTLHDIISWSANGPVSP